MVRIVLVVQPVPAGLSLTWSDGPAAFPPYELPLKPLAAAAEAARRVLGAVAGCALSGDEGEAPAASAALADAGFALYQALFKPGAEQMARATEVRKWLDRLHERGAVEHLEVVADGVGPVPWNLVYDRRPDGAAFRAGGDDPARWLPFWGIRYDLSCGRRVSPLRRFPVLNDPRVVAVADPAVIDNLPDEARGLAELCRSQGWPLVRSRAELADALAAGRPDLLYWLGHTQDEPFGLVLGEDVVTPDDLRGLLEGDPFADAGEVFGGVAFLNACGTAQSAPSGSFQDALHPLGLSGLIATEQVTIDTFAAPLGREFLRAFAVDGQELGDAMRALRGRVPLGLIYGSYCPPALKVRRATGDEKRASGVKLTRITSGTKLGLAGLPGREARPLPAHPYRSLRAYGVDDRALFAGRDDDVFRFARLLDDPGTRVLILHGESGVGKTSFLRAGVIPFLETECPGFRFARDRSRAGADPVLLVRATNDPVSQLAAAVAAFCARPLTYHTPAGDEVTADLPAALAGALGLDPGTGPDAVAAALRAELRADPGLLGRLLAGLGQALPFAPVLVLDQAEEVFTLARTPADDENRVLALEMLRRAAAEPGGFKVVVSLRTEYHGRFVDRLRRGAGAGVREYLLTDFGFEALVEVIRRPTATARIPHATEVPFEKYGFRYADGVPEEIARAARAYTLNRQDSVLPLVQVLCLQLYDRVRGRAGGTVTAADLEAIGGVRGGMKRFAEDMVQRLFPRRGDRAAFRRLLAGPDVQLFIQQPDGALTTALLPAEFLAAHWTGPTPFDRVLSVAGDGDWRLLRVNTLRIGDEAERPYVSLGHDALAHVAARWAEERKRWAQVRRFVAAVAVLGAIAGGLFALSGWALEQKREATRQARNATASAARAGEALAAADAARERAEDERRRAVEEQARADQARNEARAAEDRTFTNYREVTLDALDMVRAAGRPGPAELTFLEKTRARWVPPAGYRGDDPRKRATAAEAQFRIGLLDAALGDPAAALARYEEAVRAAEGLRADFPGAPEHRFLLARVRVNKAVLLAERGAWDQAWAENDAVDGLIAGLLAGPPAPADPVPYLWVRAMQHNNLGGWCRQEWHATRRTDPAKAAEALRRARAEFERAQDLGARAAGTAPDRAAAATLATFRRNLGLLCTDEWKWAQRAGAFDRGRAEFEQAVRAWEQLARENKGVPEYQLQVLSARNDLGALLAARPDLLGEARALFEAARALGEELVKAHPAHPGYRLALARCLCNLGFVLPAPAERLPLFERVLGVLVWDGNEPTAPDAVTVLRDAYRGRAGAREALALDRLAAKQERAAEAAFAEAHKDWAEVARLSADGDRPAARYDGLGALYGFNVARALTAVDELRAAPGAAWTAGQWYRFAQMYSLAVPKAGNPDENGRRVREALACLAKAVELGWRDAARAEQEAAPGGPLAPIENLAEFKRLVAQMRKAP